MPCNYHESAQRADIPEEDYGRVMCTEEVLNKCDARLSKDEYNEMDKDLTEEDDKELGDVHTPTLHTERRRENQRDIREAEDGSPRRRRFPLIPGDENVPATAVGASARSLGQLRRYQRRRTNPPPEVNPSISLAQQARRARERAEKEMRMDIDDPPASSCERVPITRLPLRPIPAQPSRALQALANGLLTPPNTQRIPKDANRQLDQNILRVRPQQPTRNIPPARRRGPARRTEDLFMIGRREYRDPEARHDFGRMNDAFSDCGALHWEAEQVAKPSKDASAYGMCCNRGKAQEFRSHITQYNAALAFTSLGVNDEKNINKHGPNAWVFRILGNLRHVSGALTAPEGTAPSYAQLYMYDPSVALQQRMNRNSNLRQDTMQSLQTMLTASHVYAPIYKQAYEILEDLGNDVDDAEIRLRVVPGNDRR
ncbi:hypothetical protein B0H13DRAFT_2372415 [Mycena leptocephala]|nr:hypothetical protein B0H13DRAFT_2372415 [Mycena leptocephala]